MTVLGTSGCSSDGIVSMTSTSARNEMSSSEGAVAVVLVPAIADLVRIRGREKFTLSGLCESCSQPNGMSAFRF